MRRLEEWPFTTEFGLQAHLHRLHVEKYSRMLRSKQLAYL